MGQGYYYTCKKCKYEYSVYLGEGMMFPKVYRETFAAISKGEYGSDLQEVYKNTPYAAIDGGSVVYICNGCGSWELDTDVSLYAPNDPDSIAQKQEYESYVTDWELKKEYHLIKRHYHHCSKCGKRMHKASSAEERNLPCPNCGCPNQAEGTIMWD